MENDVPATRAEKQLLNKVARERGYDPPYPEAEPQRREGRSPDLADELMSMLTAALGTRKTAEDRAEVAEAAKASAEERNRRERLQQFTEDFLGGSNG